MISRALLMAAAFGAALTLAAPARADGFNVGFFLGAGPSNWLPKCNAPELLTEVKDRAGKLHWICAKPAPANTSASNMQAPGAAYARR